MQVTSLRIKNFLSIGEVEIAPGQVNQICGNNNQGKTTILKALEFAVKGSTDPSMVKIGEELAEVIVELDDETVIRRRLNAESGKQSLSVTREGFKAPSQQAFLDALFAGSSFNPLSLLDGKNRQQAIMSSIPLKLSAEKLAGGLGVAVGDLPELDFSEHGLKVLDSAYRHYYQRRADANKAAKEEGDKHKVHASELPPLDSLEEIDVEAVNKTIATLQDELLCVKQNIGKEQAVIQDIKKNEAKAREIDGNIATVRLRISELKAELAHKENRLKEFEQEAEVVKAQINSEKNEEFLAELNQKALEITEKIGDEKNKLTLANRHESVKRQHKIVDEMGVGVKRLESIAQEFDEKVVKLRGSLRAQLLAECEMPCEGLTYEDGSFKLDGIAIDNLSTSKAIKLAVDVARTLCKKSRVICIDGAEALDEQTWSEFRKEIEDDGFTYFITRVGGALKSLSDNDRVIKMSGGQVEESN
jgi:energy-coupling factor transporter ATP-binding protein EcfA2